MPGVGLMFRVVGLGSSGPEFKSRSAVELIPGGVNNHQVMLGDGPTSLISIRGTTYPLMYHPTCDKQTQQFVVGLGIKPRRDSSKVSA